MIITDRIQKPRKVLIVDDQEINRDVLGAILEENYVTVYAEDGAEALEKINEDTEGLSLVMLDIFMPKMSGFEVLRRMKEDERMKSIPVIVLTSDKSAELEALQLGAADFITKPFDAYEIILARVERIIELSEGRSLISSAEHDRLSGLYNRSFFFEYAERLFTYYPDLHLDAAVINIEQFHSVNALNGREFGDRILETIGGAIKLFLEGSDGIAARFTADIFAVYCVHQKDYHLLLAKLQKKVDNISPNVSIRLRMGVKEWVSGDEPLLMFDHASAACNMIRGNYQQPLMIYDEGMRKRELFDQRLLNDLRTAVEDHQFTVYYQPKYNIQCEPPVLSSAEALIRWKHPELGMISPGDFIPLFESKGLISIVDSFVWRAAAEQAADWKNRYGITIPVSVNLSRADVFDPLLVHRLKRLIDDNGLEYSDIKLEITESAYTDNARELLDVVDRLRKIGFEVEMDDFGSGYSSLNMLSSMPIDVLKMDMKFIRNIEHNETDRRLVELILDIAKLLKVPVVAEGVETDGQLDILRKGGCDLVQGYYFSRPLPPGEFDSLIEKELNNGKDVPI
ncbi:diguanylate cyclase (GGDEF) domain-containing protein [Ruminococcaceae bacterium FB2012]|nr:diguanylate cyclase (GGDEF) domain-containing protein [Ruminococcaceae bacterium FB2012]